MNRPILVLRVADSFFGIDITSASSVIAPAEPTPLPKVPDYIKGVISLGGSIVPMLDLAARLGIEGSSPRRVCVVETDDGYAGLLVDDVLEVVSADKEANMEVWAPARRFVGAVTRVTLTHFRTEPEEAFVMILDLPTVLDARAA